MKITLKDFGPISHFEFDLEKDLHVIFGKNNIGKSYAITAVYLILKNLIIDNPDYYVKTEIFRSASDEINRNFSNNSKNIENAGYLDVTKKVEETFQGIIEGISVREFQLSLLNSFDSLQQLSNQYSKTDFTIRIENKYVNIEIALNMELIALYVSEFRIKEPVLLRQNDFSENSIGDSLAQSNSKQSYIFNFARIHKGYSTVNECLKDLYDEIIFRELSLVKEVYFLPASRSGMYQTLNSFSPIMAELSKSRKYLTQKIALPNIAEPVADYFLNLSNIDKMDTNAFHETIETLEKEILKGKITFNNETKKMFFSEDGINLKLELSNTSSMVSEIAPIVAFFKYIINQPDGKNYSIIFIEEPEVHLHPEIQVKLIEVFAKIADKNLKVVMTSHSNYMFNKLSNLLLEGKIDYNKVSSYMMRATKSGTVTDMFSMKAEADGMNDENFADVAEMLYEERIKIYDKINNASKNAD